MDPDLSISIAPPVRDRLPDLRVHTLALSGARIGVGHAGLDPLRRRVFDRTRPILDAHRDPHRIPSIAVFDSLVEEGKISFRREPTVHALLLRMVARREPFPVIDDANDLATLLTLYYLTPVFLWDRRRLAPPCIFGPGPPGLQGTSPEGRRDLEGVPVFADRNGAIASLSWPIQRAAVTTSSRNLLLAVLDPGIDGGIEHEALIRRAGNWFETLVGARVDGAALNP